MITIGRILGVVAVAAIGCGREEPPAAADGSEGSDDGIASVGSTLTAADASGADTSSASSHVDGSSDASSSESDTVDDDSDDDALKFDVPTGGTEGPTGCGQGDVDGTFAFSIIWIANSPDGTVSKIDTTTATELARYRTGAGAPDPSRTSVNLEGDVAVSNRQGSVTKIAAELENCIDADGDGTITTSQGPADVLAWGEDECVLWHHDADFDESIAGSLGGPRATAWAPGVLDEETCETVGADLWFGFRNQPAESVTIRRLDGKTGALVAEVVVDEWPCNWDHGPYGGAIDANGDFWGLGTSGSLFRIDGDDMTVERWDNDASHVMYGIALAADGTPWIAGWSGNLWSFDLATTTWIDRGGSNDGPTRLRGLAIDQEGSAWIAGNEPCGLMRYDTAGGMLLDGMIELPGCATPVGVSIDVDGMVWVVDKDADKAFKLDPSDNSVVTVEGLVDPYTYSDMTGAGLNLVVNPPG